MDYLRTNYLNILHLLYKKAIFSLFVLVFCIFAQKTQAQSYEYDYKENAVYIYNFIKYTEWPSDKDNIVIGVIGYTPFVPEFRRLLLKKKNSNINITIKYIKPSEVSNVNVVLVASGSSEKLKDIHSLTSKLPILIITEKGDLNRQGACISLFIDEDDDFKTRYQLSLRNCRARGLAVSEQILSNAILVR